MSGWSETSIAKPSSSGPMRVRERTNGCSRTSRTWSSPSVSRRSAEIEVVGRVRVGDAVAAEGRGVEDDPAAVGQAVAAADGLAGAGQPLLAEEDVGPRDPEARHEAVERLAEGLRVMRRGGLRGDQADVVVRVDPHPAGERLVDPERLVEHAVADLLERPARMPGLDDRRPGARLDDVDREEVVVDDEHPRRWPGGRRRRPPATPRRPGRVRPTPADGRW